MFSHFAPIPVSAPAHVHVEGGSLREPNCRSHSGHLPTGAKRPQVLSFGDRIQASQSSVEMTLTLDALQCRDCKYPDIGYGLLRMSAAQPLKPFHLGQPLYALLLALLFEWGVAIQELELGKFFTRKKHMEAVGPQLRRTGRKMAAQVTKDYIAWPLLGVALALPFALAGAGPSLLTVFLVVFGAGAVACLLRSLWTYIIIFCGHFPEDVHVFTKAQEENETRARWYVRQLLGSCSIGGGRLFHVLSGNLSHQIEHHLFPDLPATGTRVWPCACARWHRATAFRTTSGR